MQAGGPEAAARLLASFLRAAFGAGARPSDGEVNASYVAGLWAVQKPEFAAAFVREGALQQLVSRWGPDAGDNLPFLLAVLCRQDPAGVRAVFEQGPARAAGERLVRGYRSDSGRAFAGLDAELAAAWAAAVEGAEGGPGAGPGAPEPFSPFAKIEATTQECGGVQVDVDEWLDWRRSGFLERWAAAGPDRPADEASGPCGACGADGARLICGACKRTRYCSQARAPPPLGPVGCS
eukprot:tig00020960_g16554.t1